MRTSVSLYHRHRFPAENHQSLRWLYFRFALSFRDVEENQLKKTRSHLALGVFYVKAGMMTDAQREFQDLVNLIQRLIQNPIRLAVAVNGTRICLREPKD